MSIIMPAYNSGIFISEAISSVIAQEYRNWELIVVNDASTDDTRAVIESFHDPRITVFDQTANRGIGHSRNVALEHVKGSLLCTFDSDDILPPRSLSARVALMQRRPEVDVVDGRVLVFDRDLGKVLRTFVPSFEGEPLDELLALTGNCYFGPSWMIRWRPEEHIRFNTSVTHGEDLIFYLSLAKGRHYAAVEETILHYRVTGFSAMSKLDGLDRSYRDIVDWLSTRPDLASTVQLEHFRKRTRRIMFKTWLKAGNPWSALRALFG